MTPLLRDLLVSVQSEWNGWRSAEVRIGDLQSLHWLRPLEAPHPLLHAYVNCSSLLNGEIPHDCDGRSGPHRLLVCILKSHTIASTYAELVRFADELLPDLSGRNLSSARSRASISS